MRLSRVAFAAALAIVCALPAVAGHYEPVGGPAQGSSGQVWTSGGPGVPAVWAAVGSAAQLPGFRNRIINGGMDVDQRNAGASSSVPTGSNTYPVDRWYAVSTGAAVTAQQIAGSGTAYKRLQITGAASVTGAQVCQRILSQNVSDLASTTVTLAADLADSLLTSVGYTVTYPTAADNYASTSAGPTGSFTVSSTLARYSAQIALGSGASLGAQICFTVGAQTSGTLTIGNVQLESGSVATVFERLPVDLVTRLCEFYARWIGYNVYFNSTGNGSVGAGVVTYPRMFKTPTATTPAADPNVSQTNSNVASSSLLSITPYSAFESITAAAGAAGTASAFYGYRSYLNAEP